MQILERGFLRKKSIHNHHPHNLKYKICNFEGIRVVNSPPTNPTSPTPIPPGDKRQLWPGVLFTFLNRFSRCSCRFLSISEKIGILPALVCLVMATKTNLLLAQAGEGRNYLITSTCWVRAVFRLLIFQFQISCYYFFHRVVRNCQEQRENGLGK